MKVKQLMTSIFQNVSDPTTQKKKGPFFREPVFFGGGIFFFMNFDMGTIKLYGT